ncbi:hypothetical protein MUP01_02400 [Candidatus Bathyarchaeota archaeon]|nr:hypothetical protein [Candidatus Bathyarchaeota archaeon]
MSKLERRITALESKAQAGLVHILKTKIYGLRCYWAIFESEVQDKHKGDLIGSFKSIREAQTWSLEDMKKEFPSAVERAIEQKGLENLLKEKYLAFDCTVEDGADFLKKPLEELSDYERKVRNTYTTS